MNQHVDEDIDMDDETSSDEESVPEADESEKKLERMLFGDDAGFMGALKSQQERADAMQLTLYSDEESGAEEGEGEDEGDMDNVADADVCGPFRAYTASPFMNGY
jgi:U3 small nucleolar RNA-associated protein 18